MLLQTNLRYPNCLHLFVFHQFREGGDECQKGQKDKLGHKDAVIHCFGIVEEDRVLIPDIGDEAKADEEDAN